MSHRPSSDDRGSAVEVPPSIQLGRGGSCGPTAVAVAEGWYAQRMDAAYRERAERRRAAIIGGKATSFEELEEKGRELWAQASLASKLEATRDALVEAWTLGGRHGPAPRFDGSTWGVLRFER